MNASADAMAKSASGWSRVLEPSRGSGVQAIAGLALTFAFVGLFLWRNDFGELVDSMKGITLLLLVPAIAVNFLDVWFQALRLRALTLHLSPPASRQLFAAINVGIMGNNVLPVRLGTVLRAQYLASRYDMQFASMLSTPILEGFMDGVVLAALFVPVLLIVGTESSIFWAVLASGFIAAAGLLALRVAYSPSLSTSITGLWRRLPALPLPASISSKLASWTRAFVEGVASVRNGRSLAFGVVYTAGAWLATAAVYLFVGMAFSLDVDWTAYLVLTAAVNVSGIVQASAGNIGPYEFVVAEVLAQFGVPRGDAAAYAIVTHLVRLVPLTLTGLGLFAWHVSHPVQRDRDLSEPAAAAG
jgi:glycosyltransferase 2 family protein